MILKYEKLESKQEVIEGKTETTSSYKEVEKADADFVHICGHDTNPPTPCRRERIKK